MTLMAGSSTAVQRFTEAISALREAGFDPGIVHCDNTPGSVLNPAMRFDMIRAESASTAFSPASAPPLFFRSSPS